MWGQVREVRNAPSPEVANLGSFGSIPVGHYTGTPDVSVPLYTIKVGKFSLPVQAMYHLSNVKPHTPPSSLGIGWVLSAGGYIARNVKGVQDEKETSTTQAGFYFNHNKINEIENSSNKSQKLKQYTHLSGNDWYELSADEFSFNFNGYSGTFFMDKDGQWRVISDDNIKVEFNAETGFKTIDDLKTRFNLPYYTGLNRRFFDRFSLITPDGTRYEFGGDNATEYCIPYYYQTNGDIMATCWRLSKITTIDQRVINFEYAADSYMCDIHYAPQLIKRYVDGVEYAPGHQSNTGKAGYNGFLMMPSRLKKISSDNESICFNYQRDTLYGKHFLDSSQQCLYWTTPDSRYAYSNLQDIDRESYYLRFCQFLNIDVNSPTNVNNTCNAIASKITHDYLDYITVMNPLGRILQIHFAYNNNNQRHLLTRIAFTTEKAPDDEPLKPAIGDTMFPMEPRDSMMPLNANHNNRPTNVSEVWLGGENVYNYNFEYYCDAVWPNYNPMTYTDSWGYYNKSGNWKFVGEYFSNDFKLRPASSDDTKLLTLKSISYPTGGKTVFEYELNDYSKAFDLKTNSIISTSGTAGGLRVKTLSNYDVSGSLLYSKNYIYRKSLNGQSSGISKGTPCFHEIILFTDDGEDYLDFYSFDDISPYPLNFNTPSVGYSTVFEELKDGNGNLLSRTKYQYTNYDMDTNNKSHKDLPADYTANVYGSYAIAAFTSMAFERGKLTSKVVMDANNVVLEKTTYDYVRIGGQPYSTVSQEWHLDSYSNLFAFSYLYKTYANRYLVSVNKTQEKMDNGMFKTETRYQYTDYGLPSMKTVISNSGEKHYTYYYYTFNLSDIDGTDTANDANCEIYAQMFNRNIIVPIKIKEGTKTGDKQYFNTTLYAYSLSSIGVPYISRQTTLLDMGKRIDYTVEKVDKYGNPIIWNEKGAKTFMIWSHKGQRLIASVQKANYSELVNALDNNIPAVFSDSSTLSTSLDNLRSSLPNALVYTYKYDDRLNLINKTEPNGLSHLYDYDLLGRLIAEYRLVDGTKEQLYYYKYHYRPQEDTNYILKKTKISESRKILDYQFFDGLGRGTVEATNGMSNNSEYVYSIREYLGENLTDRNWLPIVDNTSIMSPNLNNLIQKSSVQYADDNAFENYEYDALGRIKKQYKAGADWKVNPLNISYVTNTSNDVKMYSLIGNPSNHQLEGNVYYNPGTLFGISKTNEDGLKVTTYTDAFGKKIMERRGQNNETYYVYDYYDRLALVLMPEFQNIAEVSDYAYIYDYDNDGNLKTKQYPDCDPVNYYYDNFNRCVCMQDGELRQKGLYRFYLYDEVGRLAIQGLSETLPGYDNDWIVFYDCGSVGVAYTDYKLPQNVSLHHIIVPEPEEPLLWESLNLNIKTIEVVNYYDDYRFLEGTNSNLFDSLTSSDSPSNAKGRLTGSITLASNGERIVSVYSYDKQGNITGIQEKGLEGNIVKTENTYTYSNKLSESKVTISHTSGEDVEYNITNDYHPLNDNLANVTYQARIGLSSLDECKISYTYDQLGRTVKTNRPISNGKGNIHYEYDIHGWLTKIVTPTFCERLHYCDDDNNPLFSGSISGMTWRHGNSFDRGYKYEYDDLGRLVNSIYGENNFSQSVGNFNERLNYDSNGNITSLVRKGLKQNRSYGAIDSLTMEYSGNQLNYVEENASPVLFFNSLDVKNGAEVIMYNRNGSLIYDETRGIVNIRYDNNNNPVWIQFDNGNVTKYIYTVTGQKLRTIHYTAPKNIHVAKGDEYENIEQNCMSADSTDYLVDGNIIYKNNCFSKILFDGGFIGTNSGTGPTRPIRPVGISDGQYHQQLESWMQLDMNVYGYKFYNKDHLGNIREIVDKNGQICQKTDYYPYGTPILFDPFTINDTSHPYKYNGKELDMMHGLNTYDYGARQYNSALPLWDRVDPLAEKYYHVSPYAYCANDPVNAIDPDGNVVIPVHGTWSGPETWKNLRGILNATNNLFGDNTCVKSLFKWSSANYSKSRTEAANDLVQYIKEQLIGKDNSEPITLVGHSHGGNVCIEAINMMMEMDDFMNRKINLLTINTPVRDDYQLSANAQDRVNHVNVFDSQDPVQVKGGKTPLIGSVIGVGEIGPAKRKFKNANNIKVDNPQGIVQFERRNDPTCLTPGCYYQNPVEVRGGDYHNSHNRVQDWIKYTKTK